MNGRKEYRMGVGASSILMIFVILCMTTLGVLSFANARANYTLTARRTAHVQAIAGARAKAQRVLAQIDAALQEALVAPEPFAETVRALSVEEAALTVTEDLQITFSVPFGEAQSLEVAVRAAEPGAESRYEMVSQYFVNTDTWEPDETLRLLR